MKKEEDVDLAIASLTPRALAIEAQRRISRAEQRARGRVEAAKAMLAQLSRTVKGSRSWRACALRRVIDEGE